jgi:hypothetical protein
VRVWVREPAQDSEQEQEQEQEQEPALVRVPV